jgi:UDP-N-acetylmuramyl pentapeptide phosphotransferase/UDP-N-acetylglucosamine-1-phosphate transferase
LSWECAILNNLPDIISLSLFAFTISISSAIAIVVFHKFALNFDHSLSDIQVAHSVPTPRYGGLAVFSAIAASAFLFQIEDAKWIVISSLPIFLIGLAEDCYFKTAPILRYIFGAISAVCGIFFSGVVLSSVDLGYLDSLLSILLIAYIFTVFCIVGLINAVNLIDGLHGLSSAISIVMSLSFFTVALKIGDAQLANLGVILAAAALGLMILNYPFGKIFLGDSGAYFMGFSLAWLMILLAMRYDEVSKWSLLAMAFWPVMETVSSIFRRKLGGRATDKPDRMHFHHIIMRGLGIISQGRITLKISNPLATIIILPLACLPTVLGVFFIQSHQAGLTICFVFSCVYILFYNGTVYLLKKRKIQIY